MSDKKREYREADREAIAAYQRAYYKANREAILARRRKYREANWEAIADYQRAYYEANREAIAAYQREYRAANRIKDNRDRNVARAIRSALGATQREMASLLGVTPQTVSLYETGCAPVNWDYFRLAGFDLSAYGL